MANPDRMGRAVTRVVVMAVVLGVVRAPAVAVRIEDITRDGMDETQWFADERARPEWIDL